MYIFKMREEIILQPKCYLHSRCTYQYGHILIVLQTNKMEFFIGLKLVYSFYKPGFLILWQIIEVGKQATDNK